MYLIDFGNYFHFLFFSYAAIFRCLHSNNSYKTYLKTYSRLCKAGMYISTHHSPAVPFTCRVLRGQTSHMQRCSVHGCSLTWMCSCLSCSALCSSRRLSLRVLSFTDSCSASSFVWALPSSSRFSLWTESSDKATTFCSISTSMFWNNRNKAEIHKPCQSLQRPCLTAKPNTLLVFHQKIMPPGLFVFFNLVFLTTFKNGT